ncbi:MAG: TauD/TfdA family dioxygenase [Alphaproteobacteria bacterium]|nr:TauD/TfdA family dioxygenase [Alphaproteobacteria bacterium]
MAVLTAQRLDLRPLPGGLGAEVLHQQVAEIDDRLFPAVYQAFLDHQLLLFRDQDLPPERQAAFARRFGEVQIHVMNQYHLSGHPELYYLSNLGPDSRPSGKHPDRGTLVWHTDGSWRERTGQVTILYAERIPSFGGETWFADMYAAYDALPPAERRRLEGLRARHNLDFSRSRRHGEDPMTEAQRLATPPVEHPVVRTHPETGRKVIFLGDHAECIVGLPYDEGRALVEEINARAVADARRFCQKWRPRDLILWDNRCLLHKAEPYDALHEARVIRRCTVLGERPR